MAESSSKGVKLYDQPRDRSTPSIVYCVNALLQGPLFSESDLEAIAVELDRKERLSLRGYFGLPTYSSSHFRFGDFGVQVLQEALETWDIQITPIHSQKASEPLIDLEQESAFICHKDYREDWTCVRKVDGKWYEFDWLYPAPEHVPDFYAPAYIDSLERSGWTVYLVKGKLPEARNVPSAQARGNDDPRSPHEDDAEGLGMANMGDAS